MGAHVSLSDLQEQIELIFYNNFSFANKVALESALRKVVQLNADTAGRKELMALAVNAGMVEDSFLLDLLAGAVDQQDWDAVETLARPLSLCACANLMHKRFTPHATEMVEAFLRGRFVWEIEQLCDTVERKNDHAIYMAYVVGVSPKLSSELLHFLRARIEKMALLEALEDTPQAPLSVRKI